MPSPKRKMDRDFALFHALEMKERLEDEGVKSEICGSIRRQVQQVNDIDMVVDSPPLAVLDILHKRQNKIRVVSSGERVMVIVLDKIPYNFYWAHESEWGAMVLFLTGSSKFNIKCRAKAKERNLKLNQYGLWRADGSLVTAQEKTILRKLEMFQFADPTTRV